MVKLKKQKVAFRKKKIVFNKPSLNFKSIGKFLIGMLVLILIGVGLVKVKYLFIDSEYFIVKTLDMRLSEEKGNLRNISVTEISGESIAGKNIFFVDLEALKEKIKTAHPEFKDVIVRRVLPNKLIVEGKLRKSIAQIRSDRYYFVDEEGVVLPEVKNFPEPGLPIITGIGMNLARVPQAKFSDFEREKIDAALSLIKEISLNENLLRYKLKVVDVTDSGNISFSFELANVDIKIGNSDFQNRLEVLVTVLEQLGSDINEFKYIDLRFEDPIVGPR